MKERHMLVLFVCTLFSLSVFGQQQLIEPVPFTSVKLSDCFFAPRIQANRKATIPIALKHCYTSGRVDNFIKAAGFEDGDFIGEFPFDDTDVYKIIEGASYSLQAYPDKQLEDHLDALIFYIANAQEPDGYLFTNRTINPHKLHKFVGEKRWEKESDSSHELYNSGHLIEAAVAHYAATKKRSLLDIAIKNADLLVLTFGPEKQICAPGHQIIEMALVRLYKVTGCEKYLNLAKFFIDNRGIKPNRQYNQSHKPVMEQEEAVGHAVRAVYMYSGMADIAISTKDKNYLSTLNKIWNNVVSQKIYVTGGIGSTRYEEAFGKNYELPNLTAYCETCASIGNVYWNQRMFQINGQSKYYDVLERTLYNALLAGVSLDGTTFFYPNPLESTGNLARSKWFGCACCPSNLCRFIPSIPGYVYATRSNRLYVNLFIEGKADVIMGNNQVSIKQETNYPWDGQIKVTLAPERAGEFELALRLPGWAKGKPIPSDLYSYTNQSDKEPKIKINKKLIPLSIEDGYIIIKRQWEKGDSVIFSLPMPIQKVIANQSVLEDNNKIAIERGPIVYCVEGVDNPNAFSDLTVKNETKMKLRHDDKILGGMNVIDIVNSVVGNYTAIPYCYWANREKTPMKVWIPFRE